MNKYYEKLLHPDLMCHLYTIQCQNCDQPLLSGEYATKEDYTILWKEYEKIKKQIDFYGFGDNTTLFTELSKKEFDSLTEAFKIHKRLVPRDFISSLAD